MKKADKEKLDMILKYGGTHCSVQECWEVPFFDSVKDAAAWLKLPLAKRKTAVKKTGLFGFFSTYRDEDLVDLKIKDESMAPEFFPGDKVTIAYKAHVSNGSFAAVFFSEDDRPPVIRKVRFDGRWVKLIPSNSNYPSVDCAVDQVRFLCKVVANTRSCSD